MRINFNFIKALIIFMLVTPFFNGTVRDVFFLLTIMVATAIVVGYLKSNNFSVVMSNKDITIKILFAGTLIIAYTLLNIIVNGISEDVLMRLLQLYACCIVLLASAVYRWRYSDYKFIIRAIQLIVFVGLVMLPFSDINKNYNGALFSRGNAFGGALFCYIGIFLSVPRNHTTWDKITIILMLVLMYFANSRSALLATFIFLVARFIFIRRRRLNYKYIFFIIVVVFTVFPYFYMMLYRSGIKDSLDNLSWTYFGKRFFSGRQYIWGPLLDYINNNFFIGYGLAVTPELLIGLVWSSHNWYLQILLQMGIVGYLLIVNILRIVWINLYRRRNYKMCINTNAFMVGVLIWQGFEVTITQNNFSIGILVWLVMGMGVNEQLLDISKQNEKSVIARWIKT